MKISFYSVKSCAEFYMQHNEETYYFRTIKDEDINANMHCNQNENPV